MPLWHFVLDGLELLCAQSYGLSQMRTLRINNLFVLGLKTIEFLYKYNGNMRFWQTMAKKLPSIDVWTKLTDFAR